MPRLDVERPQLTQHLATEMWRDLVRQQLPLALRRACRDVSRGFPLIDARPHEVGHGRLARLDIIALAYGGDQLSAFDLRLALRAPEGMPAPFALAGLWIAHVDDDGPMAR
jgi:hypothetical protein